MTSAATDQVQLTSIADALLNATRSGFAIGPPSESFPSLTVDDAYEIQRINIARRVDGGERVVGRKIGLTSEAIQQQLGVDQPDYGVLTDRMVIANGDHLDLGHLLAPRIEAEFAFRIGRDLPPSPTREQLVDAVDGVAVAFEIIDSRIADWRITLVDTIADNASSAAVVTGTFRAADAALLTALPDTVITSSRDDESVGAGPGSAVLGDPLTSLLWLAAAIGGYEDAFHAGDVVLAGAVSRAADLGPGAVWQADAPGFTPAVLRT